MHGGSSTCCCGWPSWKAGTAIGPYSTGVRRAASRCSASASPSTPTAPHALGPARWRTPGTSGTRITLARRSCAGSRPATRRNMALIRKRRARPGPRQIGSSGTGSRHVRHENGGRPTNVLRLKRVAGHLMRPWRPTGTRRRTLAARSVGEVPQRPDAAQRLISSHPGPFDPGNRVAAGNSLRVADVAVG